MDHTHAGGSEHILYVARSRTFLSGWIRSTLDSDTTQCTIFRTKGDAFAGKLCEGIIYCVIVHSGKSYNQSSYSQNVILARSKSQRSHNAYKVRN